jgi:hydrogenase expression/formation protein HypD
MVYSPLDALELARVNPEREVIFFAIGFETTAPSTAVTLLQARADGIRNFSVFCNHVTIGPPLKAILDAPELRLDGLIAPGHVSAVIGTRPYDFIASDCGRPVVVAGFEPLDILQSVLMLVRQLAAGKAEVENQYARVVRTDGNPRALEAIEQTMELRDSFEWRGLGSIPRSGLRLREELSDWDAECRYEVPGLSVPDPKACQCGQVLRGLVKPWECKVFGTACTPERPIGTCMVSSEGACAAYYHYGRNRPKRGTVDRSALT